MKHFILAFLLAVVMYVVLFMAIEHRRVRQAPWSLTFTNTPSGAPALVVHQPVLVRSNLWLQFTNAQLPGAFAPATLRFDRPRPLPFELPFGKCIYLDTTFLPGSVAMELFGHQVELLPRVLLVNRQEYGWATNLVVELPAQEQRSQSTAGP